MENIISVGNATVDVNKLMDFNKEAQRILWEKERLEDEYKDLVEEVVKQTKLKKNVVSGYFKDRYKVKTKESVEKGAMYEVLNDALDN